MLRLVVVLACVIVAAPVLAQSRSVTEDIGRRLDQELRDNERASRRAMEREVQSFNSRPSIDVYDYRRMPDAYDRQRAYETEERLRRLEYEARARRYRIR